MLNDLSTRENRSWVSGLGQAANSIGQVAGVLVALPFVTGLTLFGEPGRAQALLPGVLLYGIFALPLLLWYREAPFVAPVGMKTKMKHNLINAFREIVAHRSLALLLLAYFLYSDALLTFANNFPLYLEIVHGVSDTVKSLLTAAILILAAVGAIVFGKIARRYGDLKTLKFIIAAWVVGFLVLAFIPTFKLLVPVFLIVGILFGPAWSVSRSLVGQLTPEHLTASGYSFYTVAERFATFIGPALWSITLVVVGEGALGYQVALVVMTLVMVISLFVINKIKV